MTDITFLEVPFEDKEKVKSLGAKWHSDRRKWFVSAGQNQEPFKEWIPQYETKLELEAIAPFYLIKSEEICYGRTCRKSSSVIALGCNKIKGYEEENFIFSYVTALKDSLKTFIEKHYPKYYRDFSKTTKTFYFMNHCEHCGIVLGDFFLFNEPEHAFCPMTSEEASSIEMSQIKRIGTVGISAEVSSDDLIFQYSKKRVFDPDFP